MRSPLVRGCGENVSKPHSETLPKPRGLKPSGLIYKVGCQAWPRGFKPIQQSFKKYSWLRLTRINYYYYY